MNNVEKEIWKEISGYEGYYAISNWGRIKSLQRLVPHGEGFQPVNERILKPRTKKSGYVHIAMNKDSIRKSKSIHRLVAKAFLPDWNKELSVNHLDGNKTNNKVDNLEMCTLSENMLHAYRMGLEKSMKGEENICAKLTNVQADEIREIKKTSKITLVELAAIYNVSPTTIKRIIIGKRYFEQ